MPVSPAIASPQECRDFIAAHPEIRFVEILFTSMTGVPRGKRLRIHELQAVFDHGRYLPGSVLVVDTCGQDCESTGLVWEDGDADRITRPVPGTLRPAPWLGEDVAQVMVSMYELDGRPNDLDPRHVLARVLHRFHADGLTPVAACELEYYLVDLERGAMGELRPFAPRQIRDRASQVQVYGLPELEESGPFLADLWPSALLRRSSLPFVTRTTRSKPLTTRCFTSVRPRVSRFAMAARRHSWPNPGLIAPAAAFMCM